MYFSSVKSLHFLLLLLYFFILSFTAIAFPSLLSLFFLPSHSFFSSFFFFPPPPIHPLLSLFSYPHPHLLPSLTHPSCSRFFILFFFPLYLGSDSPFSPPPSPYPRPLPSLPRQYFLFVDQNLLTFHDIFEPFCFLPLLLPTAGSNFLHSSRRSLWEDAPRPV